MVDFRLPSLKRRLLLTIAAALVPYLTVATSSAQLIGRRPRSGGMPAGNQSNSKRNSHDKQL